MGAFLCLFYSICILVMFNWIMRVGLKLFAGLSASISASPQNSPSAKAHPASDSSSPSSDKCFSHSDALASASYFNRMSRALPDGIHNHTSALSRHRVPVTLVPYFFAQEQPAHRRIAALVFSLLSTLDPLCRSLNCAKRTIFICHLQISNPNLTFYEFSYVSPNILPVCLQTCQSAG